MAVEATTNDFLKEILINTTNDFLDSLFKYLNKIALQRSMVFGSIEYEGVLIQFKMIEGSCIKLTKKIFDELVSNKNLIPQEKIIRKETTGVKNNE